MRLFSKQELGNLNKRYRAKLINGITGYKPANLIGTTDGKDHENLAVFSSIVHVGSNPPLIGFITRPITVMRNTYENIQETGHFTINAFTIEQAPKAHATSAKYPKEISEFDECGFEPEYLNNFPSPFVKGSPIGIGCKLKEEIEIKSNGTRMMIGSVELLKLNNIVVSEEGYPNLSEANVAALSSLDGYHEVNSPTRFQYAQPFEKVQEI